MKTEFSAQDACRRLGAGRWVMVALLSTVMPAGIYGQTDDFSDGNDTLNPTWIHSSVLGTVPTFDASAFNYRLQSGVGPFGYSYAGSFVAPVYTDFLVQVDLVDWAYDGSVLNVMARASDINVLAGIDGYLFGYETGTREFTIGRVINASVMDITGVGARAITLDPAKDYRLVFTGLGATLNGRAYELDAAGNIVGDPLVDYTTADTTLASGLSGVVGFGPGPLNFAVDNFVAAVPEPPGTWLAALGGLVALAWHTLRARRSRTFWRQHMKQALSETDRGGSALAGGGWRPMGTFGLAATAKRLGLALALAAGLAPGQVGAQSDDFDDGNDDGWIRYDPHNAAVISFPNGAYRLQGSTVNPAPDTARVFVYRDVDYTDFYCAVDIVDWDNSLNQAFGLFFRAQNIGPGTTTGYAVYWTPAISGGGNRLFSIILLVNDAPAQNISATTLMLDPNKSYRLVARGVGDRLTAEIYDLEDLTAPIATQTVINNLFPSGKCGLFVYSRNRTTADATFDNYYAAATAPTTLAPPATPHPVPGTPQVVNRTPVSNKNFHPPQDGIAFTATTLGGADIPTANIRLELNGQDVSAGLSFSGPANERRVTYAGLQANQLYHARITLTDATGKSSVNQWWFDTFSEAFLYSESVKIIEAEDYNYGQGQFQDPVEPSGFNSQGQQVNGNGIGYLGLPGILSVDYFDSSPDAGGTPPVPHVYRPDSVETDFGAQLYLYLDPVMGIAVAKTNDTPLERFVVYDLPDYHVLNTEGGEWLNYTRAFPSGRYQAYLRASCQTPQDVFLDGVTSDRTQFGQTTIRLARFACQPTGHLSIFRYFPAVDESGNPAILEFTEGERTLRLTIGGEPEARTRYNLQLNYLMLVRVGDLPFRLYKPVRSGDTFSVSFLSTPGLIYTLQYKDSLSDPDWADGEWVIGTGWEQTLSDLSTGPTRFYRVKAD